MFLFCVSLYQNMVCPTSASDLELINVFVRNCRFLAPPTDMLNQSVRRWDLVICVLNPLPYVLLCILRWENPLTYLFHRCLSSSELSHIHSRTWFYFIFMCLGMFVFACFCFNKRFMCLAHISESMKGFTINNSSLSPGFRALCCSKPFNVLTHFVLPNNPMR